MVDLVKGVTERRRTTSTPTLAPVQPPLHQDVRFATTADGVRIAYSVAGDSPPLVKISPRVSHIEFDWDSPAWGPWWRELARNHTLIRFDQRGCGLSDWEVDDVSSESWVLDLE